MKVCIVDLTANKNKWELGRATKLLNDLKFHSANIESQLFCFDETVKLIEKMRFLNDKLSDHPQYNQMMDDLSCNASSSFLKEAAELNALLVDADYINIRCHGGFKNSEFVMDILGFDFFDNIQELPWATKEVLYQSLIGLEGRNIFFTVCEGVHAASPLFFNAEMSISQSSFIASFHKISSDVSDFFIKTHISKMLSGEDFKAAFNETKNEIYHLKSQEVDQCKDVIDAFLKDFGDDMSVSDEKIHDFAVNYVIGKIELFDPRETFEPILSW